MIRSFVFSEGKLVGENVDPDALKIIRGDKGLHIWVDLFQPTPEETKLVLEEVFAFHPLAVEDCIAVNSLPKVEDYEEYLFIVVHAVDYSRQDQFTTSELNFFLGKEFVVTYHMTPLRAIAATIDRVQKNSLIAVGRGPDKLMHTILDSITDNYEPVMQELTKEISELEENIFTAKNNKENIEEFLFVRKEVNSLRQIVRPQAEVMSRLAHGEFKMIRGTLLPYYRNIADNLRRIEDRALAFNEQLYLAMDVFMNRSQMQTNEVIKVLTLLTAATTPLVVIGTWYGMNFDHMPELSGPFSYYIAIGITVVTTTSLMLWMKFKKWI
jgi:magnesium transporter